MAVVDIFDVLKNQGAGVSSLAIAAYQWQLLSLRESYGATGDFNRMQRQKPIYPNTAHLLEPSYGVKRRYVRSIRKMSDRGD